MSLLLVGSGAGSARADVQTTDRLTIELGVDSFAQIFRITDDTGSDLLLEEASFRDTTDVFTELRAATEFELDRRGDALRLRSRARVSLGTDVVRESASFDLRWIPSQHLTVDSDLGFDGRQFRSGSDFALSSDNGTVDGGLHLRYDVGRGWKIGTRAKGELVRYAERSIYELDHQRGDLSLTAQWRNGWTQWADFELGFGHRAVSDSAAISYDRSFGRAQVETTWGDHLRLAYAQTFERREYADAQVRSPYWNLLFEPELRWRFREGLDLVWRSPVEWLDYDASTGVYFDMLLGRSGLALQHRVGSLEWSIEPRWSWLASSEVVEDEYEQPSVVVRLDWFGHDRWWFSLSEEVGQRDYREIEADGLDLYSDYTFFRTTFVGSVRLRSNLSFDVFFSDEPEVHRRDEDDARLTLVTASLRFVF